MTTQPDKSDYAAVRGLTIERIFAKHFDRTVWSKKTVEGAGTAIRAWEKFTCDPALSEITEETFAEFLKRATASGLKELTVRQYGFLIATIVRQFRPLVLARKNANTTGADMTVRQALVTHYLPASPGLTEGGRKAYRHRFNLWEKMTSNPAVGQITTATFDEMRAKCLERGLAHETIESTITCTMTVLRHLHRTQLIPQVPWEGRRLKKRVQLKSTPTLADLSAVYAHTHAATWPIRRRRITAANGKFTGGQRRRRASVWWRGLLALAYFTGLRRRDLLTLRRDEIQNGYIRRQMAKTGFTVEIPIHPALQVHLDQLKRFGGTHVLGYANSSFQLDREMRGLSEAAGVTPFTLQSIRRLAAQQYEKAHGGAGGILLGHVYRNVDRFYLDPRHALEAALPKLAVPAGMGKQPVVPEPANGSPTNSGSALADALKGLGRDELIRLLGSAPSVRLLNW